MKEYGAGRIVLGLLLAGGLTCVHAAVVPERGSPDNRDLIDQSPSSQAQLFLQLQEMQRELSSLKGIVEEQQHTIKILHQENIERYEMLEKRLAELSATGVTVSQGQNATRAADVTIARGVTGTGNPKADPAQEKLYYDAAFSLVQAKDFAKAEQALQAFLRRYPDGPYAGNAQYWLGEVYIVLKNPEAARSAFTRIVQQYPAHSKVPDALYKLGILEQQQGNGKEATVLFQQIVRDYPKSSAAALAKKKLNP